MPLGNVAIVALGMDRIKPKHRQSKSDAVMAIAGSLFGLLAILAVSIEMPVTAAVFGAAALWLVGHGA